MSGLFNPSVNARGTMLVEYNIHRLHTRIRNIHNILYTYKKNENRYRSQRSERVDPKEQNNVKFVNLYNFRWKSEGRITRGGVWDLDRGALGRGLVGDYLREGNMGRETQPLLHKHISHPQPFKEEDSWPTCFLTCCNLIHRGRFNASLFLTQSAGQERRVIRHRSCAPGIERTLYLFYH